MKYWLFLVLLLSANVHSAENVLFFVDKPRAISIAESALTEKYGAEVATFDAPTTVQHYFKSNEMESEHLQVRFTKLESVEQLANGYEKVTNNNYTVKLTKNGEVISIKKGVSMMTSKEKS
ncbi:hypothetical protein VT25_20275 [Photobacterium leiognathi subsp. mandapamensis]|nr:hypothetical protein VT25_20275 [Photobacterium leiognathi subsp. mandapamensis]